MSCPSLPKIPLRDTSPLPSAVSSAPCLGESTLARLLRPAESTGEAWHQAAIACLVAALCGALISLAVVPDGTVSDIGVYVALAGSLAGAAGCALMAFTRR